MTSQELAKRLAELATTLSTLPEDQIDAVITHNDLDALTEQVEDALIAHSDLYGEE